jgi:23S rRNA pseudouridine2605 synthase
VEERIQKLIANAGITSRRKAEALIEQGRVSVNGKLATLGDKADPYEDDVRVDGKPLPKPERLRYIMLNKPRGVLSTVKRQEQLDRPTVVEMVDIEERVYPAGRLDLNSEGLVLLTNDGDLTNRITHPRYGHEKTYKVKIQGRLSEDKLAAWRRGVTLPDGFQTAPTFVKVTETSRHHSWLRIVMREGHKRQIREIGDLLGHSVQRLIRTHIGAVEMGDLPPGHWRDLTKDEIEALQTKTGVDEGQRDKPRSRRGRRGGNRKR